MTTLCMLTATVIRRWVDMDKLTKLAINDLKTILDFMLEYGADGSLPNMDAGGSGDKAYEASVRLEAWLDTGGVLLVREDSDD